MPQLLKNLLVIIEFIYFAEFFKTDLLANRNVLQEYSIFFESLYEVLRPKIIRYPDITSLITIFDALTKSTNVLFVADSSSGAIVNYLKETLEIEIKDSPIYCEIHKLFYFTCIPKLVRNVQDAQEKIMFHLNIAMEGNLSKIELIEEYPKFVHYHELNMRTKKYCHLILELSSRIEQRSLNKFTSTFVEMFVDECNREIRDKKPLITLNFEFQLNLAKRLLLIISIIEQSGSSGVVEGDLTIYYDFNSFTEILGLFNDKSKEFRVSLEDSLPKFREDSKDYKKVLLNNLIKCYKGLISIAERLVFKEDGIDLNALDAVFDKVKEIMAFDGISTKKVTNLLRNSLSNKGKKVSEQNENCGKEEIEKLNSMLESLIIN